ncbi:MAG: winged helix-turn-helix domain-containing protein [Pseudomonadota bacterium]
MKSSKFQLGSFTVNSKRNVLSRDKLEVRLEPKVMATLLALIEADGEVLSRDELIDTVWGVKYGGDESLTRAISALRSAIRQFEPNTEYVETIPRTGYRFSGSFEPLSAPPEKQIQSDASRSVKTTEARFMIRYSAVTLFMLMCGIIAVLVFRSSSELPSSPRVAVLPLSFEAPDERSARIAGGLSDEIIDLLTRLEGLSVISRSTSSSSALEELSAEQIGETINADYLVDGSINVQNSLQKTSIQLIATEDGSVIWSRAYDIDTSVYAMFDVQRRIATDLAGALKISISAEETADFERVETISIDAYDLFLQGLQANAQGNNDRALQYYRSAVKIDPNYAEAWAALAISTGTSAWAAESDEEAREKFSEGRRLARHAISLDPGLAIAKSTLGALLYPDDEWLDAGILQREAIAAVRTSDTLSNHARMLLRSGHIMDAEILATEALELNPLDPNQLSLLANINAVKGDSDKTGHFLRRLNEMGGGSVSDSATLPSLLRLQSQNSIAEIETVIKDLIDADTRLTSVLTPISQALPDQNRAMAEIESQFQFPLGAHPERNEVLAVLAAQLGAHELALRFWSIEIEEKPLRMLRLWSPVYSQMRQLPEFNEIMIDIDIIPFWEELGWPDRCVGSGASDFRCF